MMFVVEGGVYTDTRFEDIVPGSGERYGPFDDKEVALAIWSARARDKIDNCCHRLFVRPIAA